MLTKMFKQIAVFVLFGLVCTSSGNRVKFGRGYSEGIYRGEPNIMGEAVYKREPVYQREVLPTQSLVPQTVQPIVRGGVVINGDTISIKPAIYAQEQFLPGPQVQPVASEQMIPSQQFVRSEPVIRGEAIIRTESIVQREPVIRQQAVYQSSPVLRESPVYSSEPNSYATVMVGPYSNSGCPECSNCAECSSCSSSQPQNYPSSPMPEENYYQIQPQSAMVQPTGMSQPAFISQQPLVTQHIPLPKIIYQKPAVPAVIKPTIVHSYVAIPKIQRFYRKSYRPVTDKVQITTVPIQNSDVTGFQVQPAETFQFSNNLSNYRPATVPDPTPEPQTTPATTRSSRFPIPPISSIC